MFCLVVFLILAIRIPSANALESIVPMNAAMSETMTNELSHSGSAIRMSLVNKLDGSAVVFANLKLIPK